jgi:hypothetical protein
MQKEGKNEGISLAGNRTPASCELFFRMTSRNTDHYTTKDGFDEGIMEFAQYIEDKMVSFTEDR